MTKKRRKPMSPQQRAEAAERLAKARAKRQAINPPQYKNIHENVLKLNDDHHLSHMKVKAWIKHNKELLSEERKAVRQNVKGAEAKAKSTEGYIRNLEKYLRDGDYVDNCYGQDQQNKIRWKCVAMAYDKDGEPIRTKGVFYTDLGYRWGEEPSNEQQ